jgi:hypothetical protein
VPYLTRVAVLRAVGDLNVGFAMTPLNQAAPLLGVTLMLVDLKSADDLETAFADIQNGEERAVFAIAGGLTFTAGAEMPVTLSPPAFHCLLRSGRRLLRED